MDATMEDSTFDSRRFILSNRKEIEKRVNLDELVPKLDEKKLLTSDEYEELLYKEYVPHRRKKRLVEIVASKGDRAPRLFIECLREENEHLPHSELATILESCLQSHNNNDSANTISNSTDPNQRPVSSHSTAINASANSPLQYPSHSQTLPNSQNPVHDPSTSATLGSSSHMPPALCNDHLAPPSHSSTSGVPSATVSLEQLLRSSPEFANLVLGLASELNHRGFTFERIQRALLALLEHDAIPIQLPPDVTDFPSFCLHLRRLKMCHEADVDLLCKLLETLEQVDLLERVKAYVRRGAAVDVMQHRYQQSRPRHQHFIAFTFHNVPSLSLGQACEIKHFISDLLHIPRHTFTLVSSEQGSIGLAWQIPTKYLKHVQSSLREDEEMIALLTSSRYHFESIKLLIKEGSERIVAFTRPADPISNAHVPLFTCASGQASCGQCSVSSQEDIVSSTMDDPSPSIDSTHSHRKYCVLCTVCPLCIF